MNINNKTVRKFIGEFENLFGRYLKPHEEGPNRTKYFEIGQGERKKYSDWDLECSLVDGVPLEKVQEMLKFIACYDGFDDIGHVITDAEEFANSKVPHVSRATSIQMMAIMKNETDAPFFDIKIQSVKNSDVRELFQKSFNGEFLAWAMLTAWRKIKNGKRYGGINSCAYICDRFLLPYYSDENDQNAIRSEPEKFFTNKLKGIYKTAVSFLQDRSN